MKIPTQIWIFCVGIFLQHYTFLQKRTFCILCEKFFHFVRKATAVSATVFAIKQHKKKQNAMLLEELDLCLDGDDIAELANEAEETKAPETAEEPKAEEPTESAPVAEEKVEEEAEEKTEETVAEKTAESTEKPVQCENTEE